MLRFTLLAGDEREPEVFSACFDAPFALAREASADFAISLLGHDDHVAEAAAIALGSARVEHATEPLARNDAANKLLLARVAGGGRDGIAASREDPLQLIALRVHVTVQACGASRSSCWSPASPPA